MRLAQTDDQGLYTVPDVQCIRNDGVVAMVLQAYSWKLRPYFTHLRGRPGKSVPANG